jgi:myo-inositol-1(or 4)-monophosphatase
MTAPAASPDDQPAARLADGLDAAVREAGALAQSYAAGRARQWRKADSSVVTEADIAVDRLLRERLSALEPAAGWLSEESADTPERLGRHLVWVVDPIDGTRAFVAGIPSWVVSVALVEGGRSILGAVFNPTRGEMYAARRGHGASLNGAPLLAPPAPPLAAAKVGGPRRLVERLGRTGATPAEAIYALAYRLVSVAAGRLDAALAGARAADWDIAAADVILAEAGVGLAALDGTPPRYNRAEPVHGPLVAAREPLGSAVRAALAAADAASPRPH